MTACPKCRRFVGPSVHDCVASSLSKQERNRLRYYRNHRLTLEAAAVRRAANPFRNRANFADNKFGEKVHWSVLARLSYLPCFNCGKEPAGYTDHVKPFKYAGRNVVENLQPSCKPCNHRKSFLTAPK